MYTNFDPGDRVWVRSTDEGGLLSLTGPYTVRSVEIHKSIEQPEEQVSYTLIGPLDTIRTESQEHLVADRYTNIQSAALSMYSEAQPPEPETEAEPAAAAVS